MQKIPGSIYLATYYKSGWTQQINITNSSDGSPYDLTGATATFVLYDRNGTAVLSLSTGGSGITHTGAGGVVTITATDAQIEALAVQDYAYEFIMVFPDPLTWPMLDGTFGVVKDGDAEGTGSPVTLTIDNGTITLTLPRGADGIGIPSGGTGGQILAKASGADYDTNWVTASGTGDMLVATYDPAGVGEQLVGLTATQVLTNKTIDASLNTISNIGDTQIVAGVDAAKIANGTVSNTEYQYLNGVTSAIQTQIDGKAASSHTHTLADVTDSGALAALNTVGDAQVDTGIDAAKLANGTVSNTEYQYLNGVTSAIQTQIDGKAASSHTHTLADVTDSGALAALNTVGDAQVDTGIDAAKLANGTVSNTEYQYLNGVTSAIQTQIDGKAASSHTHTLADVTDSGALAAKSSVDLTTSDVTNIGTSLQQIRVNAAGTALEYFTGGGGGDMLASTYDPAGVGEQLVGLTATQTLTNKTIDATNNTISNIGDTQIVAGVDAAKIANGTVSNTEYQYLNGVTSAIQTQIDGKAASSHTHTLADVTDSGALATKSSVDLTTSDVTNIGTSLQQIRVNAAGTALEYFTGGGGGDMLASTYDPAGVAEQLAGLTAIQTLTNKTINAANNTISNIGDTQIVAGVDAAKIANGTVSNTEYQYLNGVTSAIQTQIDGKAASSHTHTLADVTDSGALAALNTVGDAQVDTGIDAAKLANGTVSNTEYQYLNGVTSAIQTQIDGKAASSHTHTLADVTDSGALAALNTVGDAQVDTGIDAAKLANGTVSNTEYQYLNGVTSGLQSQIDSKAASSHTHTLADVTDSGSLAALNEVALSNVDTDFGNTLDFFLGASLDSVDVDVSSNGTTITLDIEKSGGGDCRFYFSDGIHTHDTTPADSVSLTAGTDTVPQHNYVYILQSNKTLTASTSGWPSAEFAPIATVVAQSASGAQTDGLYKVHVWTDHTAGTYTGHLQHINEWIRNNHASWQTGALCTPTVGASTFDVAVSSGTIFQLHSHPFPSFDTSTGSVVFIVNDPTTPYLRALDLTLTYVSQDINGTTLGGGSTDFYNLVLWGVISQDTGDCQLMLNLPDGAYGNDNGGQASNDVDNTAIYDIPAIYKGTGFLISRLTVRENGGTYSIIQNQDLRGKVPSTAAGSGGSGGASELIELTDVDTAADTANFVLATPDGVTGNYSGRALVANDIPSLTLAKISDSGALAAKSSVDLTTSDVTNIGTALQQIRVNAGGTALEYFTASSGGGDILDGGNSTGSTVVIGTNDSNALHLETNNTVGLILDTSQNASLTASNAATTALVDRLTVDLNSTGTPGAGFGPAVLFRGESSTTNDREMARIGASWTTATDASREAKLSFQLGDAGGALSEVVNINVSDDAAGAISVGSSSPVSIRHDSIVTGQNFTIGDSSFGLTLGDGAGAVTVRSTANNVSAVNLVTTNTNAAVSVNHGVNTSHTSGDKRLFAVSGGVTSSSGTGTLSGLKVQVTVNQTGTATGDVKMIEVAPTLTDIGGTAYGLHINMNDAAARPIYQTGSSSQNNLEAPTAFGTTSANDSSALVDMVSTTKGLGVMSMTSAQRDSISTPRDGLMIYNSTDDLISVRQNSAWVDLATNPEINAQTGTSYTLVLGDRNKLVTMSNASANTLTVPPNSSVAYPVSTTIHIAQTGAGQTTIAEGSGVTINSADSDLKLRVQYSGATLTKTGTNEWLLVGDITT